MKNTIPLLTLFSTLVAVSSAITAATKGDPVAAAVLPSNTPAAGGEGGAADEPRELFINGIHSMLPDMDEIKELKKKAKAEKEKELKKQMSKKKKKQMMKKKKGLLGKSLVKPKKLAEKLKEAKLKSEEEEEEESSESIEEPSLFDLKPSKMHGGLKKMKKKHHMMKKKKEEQRPAAPIVSLNINQANINNNGDYVKPHDHEPRQPAVDSSSDEDGSSDSFSIDDFLDEKDKDMFNDWDLILEGIEWLDDIMEEDESVSFSDSFDEESSILEDLFESDGTKDQLDIILQDKLADIMAEIDILGRTKKAMWRTYKELQTAAESSSSEDKEDVPPKKKPGMVRFLNNKSNHTIGIRVVSKKKGILSTTLVKPGQKGKFDFPSCHGPAWVELWDKDDWVNLGKFPITTKTTTIDAGKALNMTLYTIKWNHPSNGNIVIKGKEPAEPPKPQPPKPQPPKPSCPAVKPEVGSPCNFEGKCFYGEETCCDGSVHHSKVMQCSEEGLAVGYHTDACFAIKCDADAATVQPSSTISPSSESVESEDSPEDEDEEEEDDDESLLTTSPTEAIASSPTPSPTEAITDSPTPSPTVVETLSPTEAIASSPTPSPTEAITDSPTPSPTVVETLSPTEAIADSPTPSPTVEATFDSSAADTEEGFGTGYISDIDITTISPSAESSDT